MTQLETSTPGYSIRVTHGFCVVSFHQCSKNWRIPDMADHVKSLMNLNQDLIVIADLSELPSVCGFTLRAVWKLAQLVQTQGKVLNCVASHHAIAPVLDVFAESGLIHLYSSFIAILKENDFHLESQLAMSINSSKPLHSRTKELFVW